MGSDPTISQGATLGAHDNTFVAQQNNYGLSAKDAADIAFQMFNQYYPQFFLRMED